MNEFMRVWGIPIGLGLLSGFGLVSALVADAIWDMLSWLTLGVPLVVIGWFVLRLRSGKS